jgi:hypothetical protein
MHNFEFTHRLFLLLASQTGFASSLQNILEPSSNFSLEMKTNGFPKLWHCDVKRVDLKKRMKSK